MWTPYSCIIAHLRNNVLLVYLPFQLFAIPEGPQLQKCSLPGVERDIAVTDYHSALW